MGKKGSESEMWTSDTIIFWMIFGFVMTFVAIIFVFIISKSGAEKASIYENLEVFNNLQRFLKSPECFVRDKDKIIAVGLIDYEKFNDERLNNCYMPNQNDFPAFKLTLISDDGMIYNSIKTRNWNSNRNFEEKMLPKDIIIFYQDKLHKGRMEIEAQNVR